MANGINWWEPGGIFSPKESFGREQYGLLGPAPTTPTLLGSGIFGQTDGTTTDGCQFGYHKNAAGQCVPETQTCPAGQTRNAAGKCVSSGGCPAGQTRNAAGVCVTTTTEDGCQYGKCADGSCKDSAGNCGGTNGCQYGKCPDGRCKTSSADNCGGVTHPTCATHGGANKCGTYPNCVSCGPVTPTGRCESGPRRGLMPHPVYGCGSAPVDQLCQSGPRAGMAPHPVYGCSDTGEQPCPDGSRPNVHTGKCDELGVDRCWDGMPPEADGTCNRRGTVQVTTQQGLADAPLGEFMGRTGTPSDYMGADLSWGVDRTGLTGNVEYVDPWQATVDPVTGLLRSAYYDDPNLVERQNIMAGILDSPESQARIDAAEAASQSILAASGVGVSPDVSADQRESANEANDAVKAAEKAQNKADKSGSDADKKAADKAKKAADKAVADAEKKADNAAIKAAAEASRKAEADRAAKVAAEAEKQRQESAAAMAAHWKWMEENEARRAAEEQARIAQMGFDQSAGACPAGQSRDAFGNCISTANIWS